MVDMYGKNVLLGALIILTYSILSSTFSLFVNEVYYRTIFLVFGILNSLIGVILVAVVYFKIYFLIRNILKDDVGLKEVLKGGSKKKGEKD